MAAMKKTAPLPLIDGIKPSYLHLPCDKKLHGTLLLDFLCRRFPYIGREIWAGCATFSCTGRPRRWKAYYRWCPSCRLP